MKTLSSKSNFLGIEKESSSYENSEIVIYSASLENTVSYGSGTKNGPKEILKASHYVEFYDEETNRELCFEKGIATLPINDFDKIESKNAVDKIEREISKLIKDNKFTVLLGGEHTVTLGSALAHNKAFSNLSILQIDAHSDLRESYDGSIYSHASVMRRVYEFNKNIIQVGIRAQCKEENDMIRKSKIKTFYAREIRQAESSKKWQNEVLRVLSKNVYITFDIDGLDPSIIPATGTPEPGGLFWDETLDLIKLIGKKKNIVGFDLVELAPTKFHPASNFIAAKLVYKMLNYAYQ
ncbi:Agmatinase [hydrothermal vent metagenome]|uniref:Agmatinase n=1 Tax=hydrothermal vent metagenome TaxID=652676 RepID=A0A3B1CHC4_9ZZZZ